MTWTGGVGTGVGRRSKRKEIFVYIQVVHFMVEQKPTHREAINLSINKKSGKKKPSPKAQISF